MAEMDMTAIEKVLLTGDLAALTPDQRLSYYKSVCDSLGLNPLTQPFGYITFDGRLQLYSRKDCTEQLRRRYNISLSIKSRELNETVYTVVASASLTDKAIQRQDESVGVASVINKDGKSLVGTALANAMMKAETKAKRRVTLSICGLGMLDESEVADYEYDQRPTTEIIERNVRQATANATGDDQPFRTALPVGNNRTNEFGPLVIDENNYKDLKVHIGKAEGQMLGRKIGELHANVLEWLFKTWRDKLSPSATEQDFRLKKAVELAYQAPGTTSSAAPESPQPPVKGADTTPVSTDQSRAVMLDTLTERIDDMVMLPTQFCQYLGETKFATVNNLTELTDDQLAKLLDHWQDVRNMMEVFLHPPTVAPEKKKKGRKK
jgi:hypothetical protein